MPFAPAPGVLVQPPTAAVLLETWPASTLRIGVEFLPPTSGDESAPRTESLCTAAPAAPPRARPTTPAAAGAGDAHLWTMTVDDLLAQDGEGARMTLRFVDELMGEDRRRIRRTLGTPILSPEYVDLQSPGIDLASETLLALDEAEWLAGNGMSLLTRPLKRTLRATPLGESFDVALDEFRSDNVPLSRPYSNAHADERHLGRLSMRIHAGDLSDPLEVAYLRSGVRIGSSRDRLKLGVGRDLGEHLRFDLHSRYAYATGSYRIRADLSLELTRRSSLHFVLGNDLDFLATSTVYSLFESPMDGSPGLLLYAVHLF
jgi:hypothetical protein